MKKPAIGFSARGFLLLPAILLLIPGLQAQTTINFDTDPSGAAIAAGSVVNTTYASVGITFSRAGAGTPCGTGPNVYANNDLPSGFGSSPNAVSLCPQGTASDISENGFGLIKALFTRPTTGVCIDVRPDGASDSAVLKSFDAADNLLASVTSSPGVTQTLCVSGAEIWGVQFSGAGSTYARFDNLVVAAPPVLQITMNKPNYVNGDSLTATNFKLQNLGPQSVPCELKVWLGAPGIPPIALLNMGSDGSFVLPQGINQELGPITLLVVNAGFPRGQYDFSSRVISPVTGKTLSEDINPFVIQ
jgi:hypothetical protein